MKINTSYVRSHYPETLGIRRGLQKLKVKRITRHTLPKKYIELCELQIVTATGQQGHNSGPARDTIAGQKLS